MRNGKPELESECLGEMGWMSHLVGLRDRLQIRSRRATAFSRVGLFRQSHLFLSGRAADAAFAGGLANDRHRGSLAVSDSLQADLGVGGGPHRAVHPLPSLGLRRTRPLSS